MLQYLPDLVFNAIFFSLGLATSPLIKYFNKRKARRLNSKYTVSGEFLQIHDTSLFVDQFFPSGIELQHISAQVALSIQSVDERISNSKLAQKGLLEADFIRSRDDWAIELDNDPRAWNGLSLALERREIGRFPTTEEAVLSLWFREESYASARAAEEVWLKTPLSHRRSFGGEYLRNVDTLFSNGFGLNCTIETADGLLLLTKRGSNARGWNGFWHTSFNEGVSTADRRPGRQVDIPAAFARGMEEELGISRDDVSMFDTKLSIHSLILDVDNYQWGLLAHLNLSGTDFTSNKIRGLRNVGAAADDWEASDLRFIDFGTNDVDAILSEIENANQWVPHGLLNVALSAINRHPSQAKRIRNALLHCGMQSPI